MSDEIEIEEHDLLDDPTVRNIFPDIDRLKQEILEYEYNEETEDPEPNSNTSDYHLENAEDDESSFGNDAESQACYTGEAQHNIQNNELNLFIRGDKRVNVQVIKNKIILGSKPAFPMETKSEHYETHVKPYCAAVVLEDFGFYLKSSERYCKTCCILFPTNSDYIFHEQNDHLELVDKAENLLQINNVKKNDDNYEIVKKQKKKIVKSDKRNEVFQEKTEEMLIKIESDKVNICLLCKCRFSRKSNLKIHMFKVHKIGRKKLDEIFKIQKSSPRATDLRNECFHCNKSFRTQHLLIEHIYSILQTPNNNCDKNTNKILVGNKSNNDLLINKVEKQDRTLKIVPGDSKNDITSRKKIEIDKKASEDTNNIIKCYRCRFCYLYFKTIKFFSRHMSNKHKTVKHFPIAKVEFDPKCKHCSNSYDSILRYNNHLHKSHSHTLIKAISESKRAIGNANVSINKISKENACNVTNSEYYRCSICYLYFRNLKFYARHMGSKHNNTKISNAKKVQFDPKCKYCPRISATLRRYNTHFHRNHDEKVYDLQKSKEVSTTAITKSGIFCHVCKYCHLYFLTTKYFNIHMTQNHKSVNVSKNRVKFNPICKFCPKIFNTIVLMNAHIRKCHFSSSRKSTYMPKAKYNAIKVGKGTMLKDQNGIDCYRCRYCPVYFKTKKFYDLHMKIRHKTLQVTKPLKVKCNLKCEFCPLTYKTIQYHNKHVYNHHYKELNEIMKKAKSVDINDRKKKKYNEVEKFAHSKGKKFYRCCYCSYYFKTLTYYNNHVVKNHKVQGVREIKKIEFDSKCKYCPAVAINIIKYNKHLYRCHRNRLKEVFETKPKIKVYTKTASTGIKPNILLSSKNYTIKSKLSLLPSSSKSIYTKSNTDDGIVPDVKIFPISKSSLFKCNKCDIYFLTIRSALDHSYHMEMLINWKCTLCHRIFKDNDRWLHEKQHVISHEFTVYDIDQSNIAQILYKCSKCAMHFDESVVDSHHRQCATRIPKSYVCKICDILVDCKAQICHEYNHKHRHFTSRDFIIIETTIVAKEDTFESVTDRSYLDDVDDNNHNKKNKRNSHLKRKIKSDDNFKKSKRFKKDEITNFSTHKLKNKKKASYSSKVTDRQLRFDKISLKLSFCNVCKCFISIIGSKRKVHAEGKCAHLLSYVCKYCGLRLSSKTLSRHQQIHARMKNLQLQHFKFYDFKTGKRVQPPMPKYEKCRICDVNFISKSTLLHHVCGDKQYETCDICNIKLYKQVIHLHMAFHKYSINEVTAVASLNNTVLETSSKKPEVRKSVENFLLVLYCCKVCYVFMDTYDRLIEHCQQHCLNNLSPDTEECKICMLKFEDGCLKSHAKLHEKHDTLCLEKLFVDPFYFRFENKVWLKHIFGSHPVFASHHKMETILLNSPYRFEHRFRMEISQEGSPELTLYKCLKCSRYIEAEVIYQHVENSCSNLRKYPCTICKLDFVSSFSLNRHKTIHTDNRVMVYRIINFNREEDAVLNEVMLSPPKLYVLYQCRRCNGVVDGKLRLSHNCNKIILKSCTDCKLLINEDIYDIHISMHKTLDSYVPENMKLILFGQYTSRDERYVPLKSSFRGKIHDYSFFKCSECQVCVKNKNLAENHTCSNVTRVACSVCGLYFYSDKLVAHVKSHETDPDLLLDNMIFIKFHPSIPKPKEVAVQEESQLNNETYSTNIPRVVDSENVNDKIENKDNEHKEDKACEEIVDTEISENIKVTIQAETHGNNETHFKTGIILKDVDSKKNLGDKYERTAGISENNEPAKNTASDFFFNEELSKPLQGAIYKEIQSNNKTDLSDIPRHVDSKDIDDKKETASNISKDNEPKKDEPSEEIVVAEKIADIYKCECGLHFLDEHSITKHFIECGSKMKQAKQNCIKCGLLFTPNVLFKHLLTHHGDKKIIYKINIIQESTNNIIQE